MNELILSMVSMLANLINVGTELTQVKCSSAIAERPHGALCPSVVSLNNIITHAVLFIIVS